MALDFPGGGPENVRIRAFRYLFVRENTPLTHGGWIAILIGIGLVAIVTSVCTNFFDKFSRDYREGLSTYRLRGHVAILGFDASVPKQLRQMMEQEFGRCYFLVMTSADIAGVRTQMDARLTTEMARRVILLKGEISSPDALARMCLKTCREIHIFGDVTSGYALKDNKSLACLDEVEKIRRKPLVPRVPCYLLFENKQVFSAFQIYDKESSSLVLYPLYREEMNAHKLFLGQAGGIEGPSGIAADAKDYVHLVVFGMTGQGVAMGMEAAMLAHYPNQVRYPDCRTRITFIDVEAEQGMKKLTCQMGAMFSTSRVRMVPVGVPVSSVHWKIPDNAWLGGDFMDLEWEFINGAVFDPAVREYLDEQVSDPFVRLTVAVCFPQSDDALSCALSLPESIFAKAIQVAVWQRDGADVVDALSSIRGVSIQRYATMRAFGTDEDAYDAAKIREWLKQAEDMYESPEIPLFGNPSKTWAAQLSSNFYNIAHGEVKRRCIKASEGKISMEEMADLLAKTEHNRWNAEQLVLGFRPLMAEEQQEVIGKDPDSECFAEKKSRFKREKMAHLDICSWQRLGEVDPDALAYDSVFVKKYLVNT